MSATQRFTGTGLILLVASLATGTSPPTLWRVQEQGEANVWAFADQRSNGHLTVTLSGVIKLQLTVEGIAPLEVEQVRLLTPGTAWKLTSSPATTLSLQDGRLHWGQWLQLHPLESGAQSIDLAPLRYRDGQGKEHTVTWQPIPVTVTTAITRVDVGEARDITDIEHLPPVTPWWLVPLWVGLGLLMATVAVTGWFVARRWHRARPGRTAAQVALRELDRLAALKLSEAGRVERFHTLLSNILRRYFERRLQLPVRRQTTTEFLEALRQAPELPAGQQTLLRDFLERCDLAKFAGVTPPPEACAALALMARALVEQTAQSPAPAASGAKETSAGTSRDA